MLGGGYGARHPKATPTPTPTPTAETKQGKAESPQAMPFKPWISSFRWNDGEVVVRS
jgi:hypothetical protein